MSESGVFSCGRFTSLTLLTLILVGCVYSEIEQSSTVKPEQSTSDGPNALTSKKSSAKLTVDVGVVHNARELTLLKNVFSGVNEIYQQCQIDVSFDTKTIELGSGVEITSEAQLRLAEQYKNESPVMFFVPATDEVDVAFAYLPSLDFAFSSTIWITNRVSEGCLPWIAAHELGHVLLDSAQHSRMSENVMSVGCKIGNWNNRVVIPKWTDTQCAALNQSPFLSE